MAKKKISSQDFLNLMDEQESSEKTVFEKKADQPAPKKVIEKKIRNLGPFKITPLQEEWIEFAVANTPKFVWDLAALPVAQRLIKRLQSKFSNLIER